MKKYESPVVELEHFVEDIITGSMQNDVFDEYLEVGDFE